MGIVMSHLRPDLDFFQQTWYLTWTEVDQEVALVLRPYLDLVALNLDIKHLVSNLSKRKLKYQLNIFPCYKK